MRGFNIILLVSTIAAIVALAVVVDAQQPAPQPVVSNCTAVTAKPVPEVGKYVFKSCIVAQFAAYLSIGNGKYIELNKGIVNTESSLCDNETAKVEPKLVINFPCAQLQFNIGHTNDSKTFVDNVAGWYTFKENDKDGKNISFVNSTDLFFTTQSGHYYRCNSEQSVVLNQLGGTAKDDLMLSQFALEAFRGSTSGTDFYQIPEYCLLDSPPVSDLVRIGVGVCLVALVAIVLIAYFIGRRRWSERSSYESV